MENHILEIIADNKNIHIKNSYLVTDENEMLKMLLEIRNEAKLHRNTNYKRSIISWIKEWKAHNLLYNLGYQKERTGSVDLDESESAFRLIVYTVLSLIYDIFS